MTSKQCPNGCGLLTILKKPAMVAPTEDAMDCISLAESYNKSLRNQEGYFYMKIIRICPNCGYYDAVDITEREFSKSVGDKTNVEHV